MSVKIYQFDKVNLDIGGDPQKLVQKVSVKADTGLDFVTTATTGIQTVVKKQKDITIDVEYLHIGTYVDPTTAPLHNSLGFINLARESGNDIKFSGCLLVGTQSSISANSNDWGKKTLTYMCLSYENISSSTFSPTTPITGSAPGKRSCFTGVASSDKLVSFESSCTIDRELLYQPTKAKPSHICIKYPIVSTSSITRYETNSTTLKETGVTTCPTPAGSTAQLDADTGIPSGYLTSVNIDGATVGGDAQLVTYNYKSTAITGQLTRIITVP